jgi:hypothetical protein
MSTLTRLHDFETDRDATPPVAISATKVDAEFDQVITELNAQDVRLDTIEANGFVTTARLADDAVTGAKISFIDDSIAVTNKAFMIADGTDYSAFVLSGGVTCTNAGVVTIGNTSVGTGQLVNDAVTGAKISFIDDSIAITSTFFMIADGADYSGFALSGDVTCSNAGVVSLAALSVDTAELVADAVTGAKISFIDDSIAVTDKAFMIADGTDYSAFVLSGDVTCSNAGVVAIGSGVIVNTDINASAAIDASKIGGGNVSTVEYDRLNGVTSGIQAQLDSITAGTVTTIDDDNFTLQDNLDQTKDAQFQCSGISTGTTRTFTFPDADGTLSLIALAETLANKTLTSPVLNGTLSGTAFLDQDTMSSDSAVAVASQQSIKAYVDSNAGASNGFVIAMSVAL